MYSMTWERTAKGWGRRENRKAERVENKKIEKEKLKKVKPVRERVIFADILSTFVFPFHS